MRDALIHFLDRIKDYENESGHSMHEDERDSSEIVDIHLEAVPELNNYVSISNVTQWVATSDRLPEEGKVVIVWLPDVKDTDLDKICEYTTKEQFKRHYSHWMAYPEPPCG